MRDQLITLLKEHQPLTDDQFLADETLISDLGIDSLDFVELIFKVETSFGIEIEDHELAQLKTIKDFVQCLERKDVKRYEA